MDELTNQPIEQLVQRFQSRDLSRRRFMALLASLGASATGIATLVSSAESTAAASASHHYHKTLHAKHVRLQSGRTRGVGSHATDPRLQMLLDDYAEHAIVEDPLFAAPFVGKQAIAERKMAEMAAMEGVSIEVLHRFVHHNQVVAEWIVRGTHRGDFLGFPATGRSIELRGVTVVTREKGKIIKESLHYDLDELHRQLG